MASIRSVEGRAGAQQASTSAAKKKSINDLFNTQKTPFHVASTSNTNVASKNKSSQERAASYKNIYDAAKDQMGGQSPYASATADQHARTVAANPQFANTVNPNIQAQAAANQAKIEDQSSGIRNKVQDAIKQYDPSSGAKTASTSSTTETKAAPAPTTTDSTTTGGTGKTNVSDVSTRVGKNLSRSSQRSSTNRRNPRRSNSLTDQELRKLASRRFRG